VSTTTSYTASVSGPLEEVPPCCVRGQSGPQVWLEVTNTASGARVFGACAACRAEGLTSAPTAPRSAGSTGSRLHAPTIQTPTTAHAIAVASQIVATHQAHAATRSRPEPHPLVMQLARARPCVMPSCTRHDWHHGQHIDASGRTWDYGHCPWDPLVKDCPECAEDEHPYPPRAQSAPAQEPAPPPPQPPAKPKARTGSEDLPLFAMLSR
jgi:hypothetical protein